MLAQLEKIKGVREARVDWTGQLLMLTLEPSTNPEDVIAASKSILGPKVVRLAPEGETEQIAAFKAGAPWLRSGETARMSAHEARVLAEQYAADAARNAGLDDGRAKRLTESVQDELARLFATFEKTGLPSRDEMNAEWMRLVERVAERSRPFLSDAELAAVSAYLRECCSR